MKGKIVKTGSSRAVTLPRDVVAEFELGPGDEVNVSVHPQTGAIVVQPGLGYFENGQITRRFTEAYHGPGRGFTVHHDMKLPLEP